MKHSRPKQKVSDFQIEFDAMKPSVHLRSGGLCEARYFAESFAPDAHEDVIDAFRAVKCGVRATNTHHRKYRSRGGSNALSNLLETCLNCHQWIHSFPELSNRLGLSLHEWESEEI